MDPCFVLIYNHDVGSKQWPEEVPIDIRSERYAVVKLTSEICLTVWSLPGDASVKRDEPVLCNQAPYKDTDAFYSAWITFQAECHFAQFLDVQDLALESLVGEACCQQLFSACHVCCKHVHKHFSTIEERLKPVVENNGKIWGNVRKCWSRTHSTASRALEAAKEGKRFRAQTLQEFSRIALQSIYGDVYLRWF